MIGGAGYYDLSLARVRVLHEENMKTCMGSVIDSVVGPNAGQWMPQCTYSGTWPNDFDWKWEDSYWTYDVGTMLQQSWYGTDKQIWSQDFWKNP